MNEEDIVRDSKPAVSSGLSEKGSAALRKLVKAMASLCTIYDFRSRNLAGEHDLGVGEDLILKVDFPDRTMVQRVKRWKR